MFFIIGISQKQKKIEFNQMSVCPCCGRYGHHSTLKRCANCGFSTDEDFEYCPKCGMQL